MEHLLFAAYLIFFAWLVTIIPFFKDSGLTAPQLIIFFLLKIIAGIFYGWIGVYYGELAQMVDTWSYHYEGIKAFELLKESRADYWDHLFSNSYGGYGNFFSSQNSWWNDLHNNIFIMLLSLFDVLSLGNYYTNIIFYSFLTFFGPLGLYRIMGDVFPEKKVIVLCLTFLLPSFIYWTSGIHKDGVIFSGFILIIYNIYFALKDRHIHLTRWIFIILGLMLIFLLRSFLLMMLLPALVAWALSEKTSKKPLHIFLGIYTVCIILFFSSSYIHPQLNLPASVVEKQKSFLSLKGGSPLPITELKPEAISFLKNTPEALSLSLVRPFPSDVKHLLSLAASVEIGILLFSFLLFLVWPEKRISESSFLLFCVFFSFSVLLTIGYTVNFLGAIVRYRSIVLPFLVIPMIASIDWKRIFSILNKQH